MEPTNEFSRNIGYSKIQLERKNELSDHTKALNNQVIASDQKSPKQQPLTFTRHSALPSKVTRNSEMYTEGGLSSFHNPNLEDLLRSLNIQSSAFHAPSQRHRKNTMTMDSSAMTRVQSPATTLGFTSSRQYEDVLHPEIKTKKETGDFILPKLKKLWKNKKYIAAILSFFVTALFLGIKNDHVWIPVLKRNYHSFKNKLLNLEPALRTAKMLTYPKEVDSLLKGKPMPGIGANEDVSIALESVQKLIVEWKDGKTISYNANDKVLRISNDSIISASSTTTEKHKYPIKKIISRKSQARKIKCFEHLVQPYDQWLSLMIKHGMTDSEMLVNNPQIKNPNRLRIGIDRLWLKIFKYHYVRSGETMDGICTRYGISRKDLQSANNLKGTQIHAYTKLIVPFDGKKF